MGWQTGNTMFPSPFGQNGSRISAPPARDRYHPCTLDTHGGTPELAKRLYEARERRLRYFGAELFSEPAWDMLLDLLINKHRGKRVTTLGLCLAARTPDATGLRWIAKLESQGIVHRGHALDDRRVVLVEMTSKGEQLLCDYLASELEKTA